MGIQVLDPLVDPGRILRPGSTTLSRKRGRLVSLPPGDRQLVEASSKVLNSREAVTAVDAEVQTPQGQGVPSIHQQPMEPFAPAP
ncbi:MAG: hypothetical protein ACM35G_06395 [Planctomycetaceae bacterium]